MCIYFKVFLKKEKKIDDLLQYNIMHILFKKS